MKYSFPMIIPVIVDTIIHWFKLPLCKMRTTLLAWVFGVRRGKGVLFYGKTIIRTRSKGEILIGENVVFNAEGKNNLVGLVNPTILDTRGGGKIEIGNHSGFSSVVMSSRKSITIGSNVKVGGNVRIFDHDFHPIEWEYRRTPEDCSHIRTKPVVIENDCFIGTNAIILKGTRIGSRTVVAAGSVVFGLDVPQDSMVKGNPAVIVN